MRRNFAHARLVIATMSILTMIPLRAQASQCSQAFAAGHWAYTYTGTVFAPIALPAAAVGHFHQDTTGNVTGSQTHTLAGEAEGEYISGSATANCNCTGSATINVYLNGVLLRTATVNVAYSDGNHARMIFTSLTLADGTITGMSGLLQPSATVTLADQWCGPLSRGFCMQGYSPHSFYSMVKK